MGTLALSVMTNRNAFISGFTHCHLICADQLTHIAIVIMLIYCLYSIFNSNNGTTQVSMSKRLPQLHKKYDILLFDECKFDEIIIIVETFDIFSLDGNVFLISVLQGQHNHGNSEIGGLVL